MTVNPAAKPTRILFLLPNLRGGGAERVVVTLLRHLDRARFEASLAVVDLLGAVYLEDLPPDVEVIDLGCTRVRHAIPGLVRLIRNRRPDLVFSTLGHLNLALAMVRWALPQRTRLIGREATILSRMVEAMPFAGFWKHGYAFFYRRFDRIVCQSQAMFLDLKTRFGIPEAMMRVIHNPVDRDRVCSLAESGRSSAPAPEGPSRGIRFVAAGRLSREKGFDLLIEALALCANPAMKLAILGEGPLRGELEDLMRARGLQEQVTFHGFQKNPYAFIREADCFVLSSRYEGFPNVVLEALACGTPVLATPLGPATEILFGIRDCALADDISAPALARVMGLAVPGVRLPQGVVDPYSIRSVVAEYSRLFEGVCGRRTACRVGEERAAP